MQLEADGTLLGNSIDLAADGTLLGPRSVEVVFLAFDDFEESKVKRDNEGKFAAQAGGGSSGAAVPTSTNVSSTITGIVKTAGYKKSSKPGEGGTAVYLHPSGAKVIVHPAPPGKKWSSKFTTVDPSTGKQQSGEGSSLASILKVAALMATQQEAKATKAATAPLKSDPNLMDKVLAAQAAIAAQMKPEPTLQPFLAGGNPGKKHPFQEQTVLYDKGYKVTANTPDLKTVIWSKPNGAKVQIDSDTGEWIAATPGFQAKVGKGLDVLEKLLNGEKAYMLPDGGHSWENTNKTIGIETPEAKAAKEAAAAAQTKSKHVHVLSTLISHAPQGTPEEISAVSTYTGSSYASINNKLRHDPTEHLTPTIKCIDSFLAKASLPMDVTLYRKVDGEYAKVLLSSFETNDSFIDRGFVSSSPNPSIWHGSLTMVIACKMGQKVAAVKHLSQHAGEDETMVARGSRYRVKSVDYATKTMHCELDQSHFEQKAEA